MTKFNPGTVSADFLTAPIWSYFAILQSQGRLAGTQAAMIDLPGLSYGLVHASLRPNNIFGAVTTSVTFAGVLVDIGHLRHIRWSKVGDTDAWVNYNRIRGALASALEAFVPQQLFVNTAQCGASSACPQGISAVTAISAASAAGQKVYVITQANAQVIDSLSLSSSVSEDVRSAVAAGKEVTIHEAPVTVTGWTGMGYVITDPETGAGAYLIEGSAIGGFVALTFFAVFFALVVPFLVLFFAGPAAALIAAIFAGLNVRGMLEAIEKYVFDQDNLSQDQKDARLGFLSIMSIVTSALAVLGSRNVSVGDKAEGWLMSLFADIPEKLAELLNNI